MPSQYDAAIQLLIKAQDQTGPAFTSLQGNLAKTTGATQQASLATSLFSGVAVFGLVSQLQKAGQAASEEQMALSRLSNAVDNNGGSWAAQRGQIEKNIAANRRFGFSDKDLMDSLSLLTVESGSWEEALKRQRVAMDLARGTGMDLFTASRLLGKVTDENVNALKRWGIVVEKGASAGELFAEVEKRVGDAAERASQTGAVHADVLANTVTRLYAAVGAQSQAIQAISALGPAVATAMGIATGAIRLFTVTSIEGGVAATGFSRALSTIGPKAVGIGKVLGAAGLIAVGSFETVNALHSLFKTFSAPGSEGEKIAKSMDQFAAISESHGGGAGGFFATIKDLWKEISGGAKTGETAFEDLTAKAVTFNDVLGKIISRASGRGATGGLAAGASAIVNVVGDLSSVLGIKTDDPLLAQLTDILNNTVGLTSEQKFKEVGDQLYKRVHDEIQNALVDPLKKISDEIHAPGQAGRDALHAYAQKAGKSDADYARVLDAQLADAEKRLADSGNIVKALLAQQQKDADASISKFHADQQNRLNQEHDNVAQLVAQYTELNAARAGLNTGYGPNGADRLRVGTDSGVGVYVPVGSPISGNRALGGPMLGGNVYMVGEQNRREAIVKGVGSDRSRDGMDGGPVIGAMHLHYSGAADASAAARLANDVLDNVTEGLRQQTRRVGLRSSPFGVA